MESIDLSHLLSEEAQANEYIPIKERRKREAELRAERLGKLNPPSPKRRKGGGGGEEKGDEDGESKPKSLLSVADELKKAKEGLSEETRCVFGRRIGDGCITARIENNICVCVGTSWQHHRI